MISIGDYDTGFKMEPKMISKLRNMSTILIDQLNTVPIFFVKAETMDIHCSTKCLGREITLELVRSYNRKDQFNRERDSEEILKKIEKCMTKCNALGCYVPNGDDISDKPHILICPERIKLRNKNQFEDLLLGAIIHELTHTFFSTGSDLKDISKHIIEESLCEAYAFSKLGKNEEIYEFFANQNRPPEYTAFKFWIEHSIHRPLIMHMVNWKNKDYNLFCNSVLMPSFMWRHYRCDEGLGEIAMILLSFS